MPDNIKRLNFGAYEWIDIHRPKKEELDAIAEEFNLDIYQVNDSLEKGHLPKLEKNPHYYFLILRAYTAELTDRITNINELSNKIAIFCNDKKIITIHRADFDFLAKPDYNFEQAEQLVIYFLHKMIQTFVEPSRFLSGRVDEIEQVIFIKDLNKVSLEELYYHKSQTRISKKLLQMMSSVLNQLQVKNENISALQDIKDQIQSLMLTYEEVFDDSVNLLNTYLSVNAQKSNDVMKLLTIFSAFFLPLTFIAGIYGMNFENMPELKSNSGYFVTIGVMLLISIIIFMWFKRKKIL